MSLGVGGWVGVVTRSTSLDGNNAGSSAAFPIFYTASAITASASTTAFMAKPPNWFN
jgi:hypothetical protein